MAPPVRSVTVLRPYVVRVTFADGVVRDVDIQPLLDGEVFAPLRDPAVFELVKVDELWQTIVWPNGVDLDPDVIYGNALAASGPSALITAPDPS